MSKNTAIVVEKAGQAIAAEVSVPILRDDYIIVKVKAVALNPTDWKHIDYMTPKGVRCGCDYAGIVEEVGSKVTSGLKKGDRVCGFVHGGNAVNHEDGAFGNYITAKGDIQIKIPDNLSFEEAATLGLGITTVGQVLYQSLKLPLPNKPSTEEKLLLVYAGSSATGSLIIQFARLSGLRVIATCSPHNNAYVKSLGAEAVFDYNSPTCSKDIKEYSKDGIAYAVDCVSDAATANITISSMSSSGGVYATLLFVPPDVVSAINPKVEGKLTLAYTVIGEDFTFGPREMKASQEDFEFGKFFWAIASDLLQQGKVKAHKPAVNKYGEGFEGILEGLDQMRKGKVSGEKLVYTL